MTEELKKEIKRLRKLISQMDTIMILDLPLSKYPKTWDEINEVLDQREQDIWEEEE